MEKKEIVEHVNNHHHDALELIFRSHCVLDPKTLKLVDYNLENLFLLVNDTTWIQIPFPYRLPAGDMETFKKAFIWMVQNAKNGFDVDKVKENLQTLMDSYNSVVLGTLLNNQPLSSCSMLFHYKDKFYLCISELALHYRSIRQNPDQISVMWLEDEKSSVSPAARRRAVFSAKAKFIEDQNYIQRVFDHYIAKHGTAGGIGIIKKMDNSSHRFHLVELELFTGRFVQGFGQVYDVNYQNWSIKFLNPQAKKSNVQSPSVRTIE